MSPLQPEDTEADMRDKSGAAWRGLLMRQRLKTALEKPENVWTFLFPALLASGGSPIKIVYM